LLASEARQPGGSRSLAKDSLVISRGVRSNVSRPVVSRMRSAAPAILYY
jgi:hypothetical protein